MFDLIEILPQNISLDYLLASFDDYFTDLSNNNYFKANDISNTTILIEKICYDYSKYILELNGYNTNDNILLSITNNNVTTSKEPVGYKILYKSKILFDENKKGIIIDKKENNYLLIKSKNILALSSNTYNLDYEINNERYINIIVGSTSMEKKHLQLEKNISLHPTTIYNEIPIDFSINLNKVYANNMNIYNLPNEQILQHIEYKKHREYHNILQYITKISELNKMDKNKQYSLFINKNYKGIFNHNEDDITFKKDYNCIEYTELNKENDIIYNKTHIDDNDIYTIDDFLNETECNELIHIRNNCFFNNHNFITFNSEHNKSKNIFLNHDYNKVTLNICNKISKLVGYPLNNSKCMHISWFEENDFDLPHYNTIFENANSDNEELGGEILKTIIIYLNKPKEGGDTRFTLLNKNVVPEIGRLLHINDTHNIHNISTGYNKYIFALSENEKIIKGEKIILKIHFRHDDISKSHSYYKNDYEITNNNCKFIKMKNIYKMDNILNDNQNNYIKTYYETLNVNKINCINNKLTPLFINIFEQVILHNIMKIYNLNDENINVSECYITNDKNDINNISKDLIVALILLNNIDIHLLINNIYLKNVYNQLLLFDKTNSCIETETESNNTIFIVYTFSYGKDV